ncbi:hypothetical protein UT300005_05410 [Clostridium sp. CTA-5]
MFIFKKDFEDDSTNIKYKKGQELLIELGEEGLCVDGIWICDIDSDIYNEYVKEIN